MPPNDLQVGFSLPFFFFLLSNLVYCTSLVEASFYIAKCVENLYMASVLWKFSFAVLSDGDTFDNYVLNIILNVCNSFLVFCINKIIVNFIWWLYLVKVSWAIFRCVFIHFRTETRPCLTHASLFCA